MKQVIGITGASGMLGRYFMKKYKNYEFDIFSGDITSKKDVNEWVMNTNSESILHFASKVSTNYVINNYKYALQVNYLGTKNLVDSIKKRKNIWLFFSSSSHVYKNSNKKLKESDELYPSTLYGKTKLKAEKYLIKIQKKFKLSICIGRIFSLTDSSQGSDFLIPSLFKKMNEKKKIIFNNLNHERDFCHIDDVCGAIKTLQEKKCKGIFNIGSGQSIKLYDLLKIINKKKKIVIHKKKNIQTKLVANISKIKKIGFKPKFTVERIIFDYKKK